jgi:hypothetical protein
MLTGLGLEFVLKNYGNSPAVSIVAGASMIPSNIDAFAERTRVCAELEGRDPKQGATIFPGETPTESTQAHISSKGIQMGTMQMGKKESMFLPIIVGCAVYRATFRVTESGASVRTGGPYRTGAIWTLSRVDPLHKGMNFAIIIGKELPENQMRLSLFPQGAINAN